jgi:hypothetical protein
MKVRSIFKALEGGHLDGALFGPFAAEARKKGRRDTKEDVKGQAGHSRRAPERARGDQVRDRSDPEGGRSRS